MNVFRPDLVDRQLNVPFQVPSLRGHPVTCLYTIRISCAAPGTGLEVATSASVSLLVDTASPPDASSSFGTVALKKVATLPLLSDDEDEVVGQLCAVVSPSQWLELRLTIDGGSPEVEIVNAVEVEA